VELLGVTGGVRDTRDRALRDLRISVTDRCNFRCPYCMPAELFGEAYEFLPKPEILSFEEITRLARLFVAEGVTKLRITGGEPLLRAQLPLLIEALSGLSDSLDIALTTNGYLLAPRAAALAAAGLRRVTVSLDGHDSETFRRMAGREGDIDRVLDGIHAAGEAGLTPVKINCVVRAGVNEEAILPLAERFRGTGHILRFIEFMDVGTRNGWDLSQVVPAEEILARLDRAFGIEPITRGYRGEVASRFRYLDGGGEVGVIASVTRPFCGDCTRARITSDGKFVTCLFSDHGIDLKGPLRAGASDNELRATIQGVWVARDDRYSELRSAETAASRGRLEMYHVGG
jgi:cyclic pyranopterin phosphate synthase